VKPLQNENMVISFIHTFIIGHTEVKSSVPWW